MAEDLAIQALRAQLERSEPGPDHGIVISVDLYNAIPALLDAAEDAGLETDSTARLEIAVYQSLSAMLDVVEAAQQQTRAWLANDPVGQSDAMAQLEEAIVTFDEVDLG